MLCVLSDEIIIFQDAHTIPSSDGNLIIFENLDIPIAIEVPRFPPLLYVLSSLFSIFVLVFSFSFSQ
jgi:hypothetical protein